MQTNINDWYASVELRGGGDHRNIGELDDELKNVFSSFFKKQNTQNLEGFTELEFQ